MSRTCIKNKRTAPMQRHLPVQNYNDPFHRTPLMQTVNQQYDSEWLVHAIPSNSRSRTNQHTSGRSRTNQRTSGRSRTNQRLSGRSRGQRTPVVGMSNSTGTQKLGYYLEQSPQNRFRDERIVSRIEETLEPILKFTEFPEGFLIRVLLPCIPSEKAGILVAGVLLCAAKKKGTVEIGKLWGDSQLRWRDVFGTSPTEIEKFIKRNKLEFLDVPTNVEARMKSLNVVETQKRIQEKLECLDIQTNVKAQVESSIVVEPQRRVEKVKQALLRLLKINYVNEDIMNPQTFKVTESTFIRSLVLAVLEWAISGKNSELNKTQLKQRIPLLKRYIKHDVHLELQALYASQSLMTRLGHPIGLLQQIFQMFYDDDVIKRETFRTWESCTDPNESDGKAIARISVKVFLKGLADSGKESQQGCCEGQRNIPPPVDRCCVS